MVSIVSMSVLEQMPRFSRARSEERRKAGQKFANCHNMKPEQYMIRVDCALTGVQLAEFRSNDLAHIGFLYNRMSSFLMLPSSRIRLIYEGELVDGEERCTVMNRFKSRAGANWTNAIVDPWRQNSVGRSSEIGLI